MKTLRFCPRFTVPLLAALLGGVAAAQSNYGTPYYFSTLAGKVGGPGASDGTGTIARFYQPNSVAMDASGTLYVADTGNFTIRKVSPAGVVTTLAGKPGIHGSTDSTGSNARFGSRLSDTNLGPAGICVGRDGTVYVNDTGNFTIRKITADGVVTTLAGQAGAMGSADGPATQARFGAFPTSASHELGPSGLCLDQSGNLYVADFGNNTIRKIAPDGTVTTFAGSAGVGGSADGTGTNASLPDLTASRQTVRGIFM